MIPVRIPAGTRPPRATAEPKFVGLDHPAANLRCPVCDLAVGGGRVHLIVVGAEVEFQRGAWFTGAAVAVHVECALPGDVVA